MIGDGEVVTGCLICGVYLLAESVKVQIEGIRHHRRASFQLTERMPNGRVPFAGRFGVDTPLSLIIPGPVPGARTIDLEVDRRSKKRSRGEGEFIDAKVLGERIYEPKPAA